MNTFIEVGQKYTFTKQVSDLDVHKFAEATGDFNPLHLDEAYAEATMFKGRIAHGMLSAGIISAGIGMHLPGEGTIYLGQELSFLKPVRIGDTLTVTIEVIELVKKNKFTIAKLKTTCTNQKNEIVTDGIASVIPPKEQIHE